jgi:hypothetical protein
MSHFSPTFSYGTVLLYSNLDPGNDISESLYCDQKRPINLSCMVSYSRLLKNNVYFNIQDVSHTDTSHAYVETRR